MVKAYLKYTEERVLGALVGTKANLKQVKCGPDGKRLVATACNEVVNLTNAHTGETQY
jgi:hypothetical protein